MIVLIITIKKKCNACRKIHTNTTITFINQSKSFIMKNQLMLVILLTSTLFLTAQQKTTVNLPDAEILKEWIKNSEVPAIAIGSIENGQLKHVLVEGTIPGDLPVQPHTIFDVASLTKTITTLLTLQLVDDKKWDLDEPLFHYWIHPDVKEDPLHKKLTTRQVLSHSSGFANWRWMHDSKKLTFEFEPGTKFQYSGEGFEYLKMALENKFKTSFEQLVDSLIFKPNQMSRSSLIWNQSMDSTRFAGTHDKSGTLYNYEKAYKANAADNLLTTIEDFSQLALQILNQELLSPKTYHEMIQPHSEIREGIDFGLGWVIFDHLPNDEIALFNSGSDQGVNALIVLLPKSKRGLIVFTNGDNGRGIVMKLIGETLGEAGMEILNRF